MSCFRNWSSEVSFPMAKVQTIVTMEADDDSSRCSQSLEDFFDILALLFSLALFLMSMTLVHSFDFPSKQMEKYSSGWPPIIPYFLPSTGGSIQDPLPRRLGNPYVSSLIS